MFGLLPRQARSGVPNDVSAGWKREPLERLARAVHGVPGPRELTADDRGRDRQIREQAAALVPPCPAGGYRPAEIRQSSKSPARVAGALITLLHPGIVRCAREQVLIGKRPDPLALLPAEPAKEYIADGRGRNRPGDSLDAPPEVPGIEIVMRDSTTMLAIWSPPVDNGGDEVDHTCWDANPAIAAWLAAENMTSAELEQYFWRQVAARVLPASLVTKYIRDVEAYAGSELGVRFDG